ncbi:MAG TPA: alpha/beta hydrolase [Bacteroidia bacterium]|jgi:pimeloyl-ACP methyl ester carboxylesterase
MKRSTKTTLLVSIPSLVSLLIALILSLNASGRNYPFDVKVVGEGKNNIVLMPGLSSSGDVWNETVEHYKKDYKCHVLTMHGFAGAKADSLTSYKNWEQGIVNYITDHKIDKPVFMGHSIGGGMALLLASDHPNLFSKIIVVDALPCLGALSNPNFTALQNPDCSMYVKQFQSMSEAQFYAMQKQTMPSMMADSAHLEEAIQWSVKSDRKAMAEIYCQFLNTDQRETIKTIKCPALVLLEAPFTAIKPAIEEQFKNLKTGSLHYSDKALHFIMYDDTQWYFKQIDAFLK